MRINIDQKAKNRPGVPRSKKKSKAPFANMKKYAPKTEEYRELLRSCRAEIELLGYGPSTAKLNGVGELLAWLEEHGKTSIDTVTRADMQTFLEHLKTRPSRRGAALSSYTVKGYVFNASLLFDYAERHGLRGGSPLASIPGIELEKSTRYAATKAEIKALYEAAAGEARATAILHLLYGCGLRRSEAEALNLGDVDYQKGLLYVRRGKGRKRRVIPLASGVQAGLKDYQKRARWRWVKAGGGRSFLLNDRGNRMRGESIARSLKKLVKVAKVDQRITPHTLRHTVATDLVAGGMKLEQVRDFLGHDHLETTQIYAHVKPKKA